MNDKNERPETRADIVREMRTILSVVPEGSGDVHIPKHWLEEWADCIEAALKRERDATTGDAAAMRDTHGVTGDGWFGFDLDGTLARYDGWKGIDHIGEPIPAMVALIKRLHAEGKIVKIMTARVAPRDDTIDGHDARYYVCKWCAKHLGFTPDVVFQKDARMIQLYDDRVKQVVPNTGILVENLAGPGDVAAMREALSYIRRYTQMWIGTDVIDRTVAESIVATCAAALAAPARNCDRFEDALDARAEWDKIAPLEVGDAFDWLFDPVGGGAE